MRPSHLPTHPRVEHPGAWWLWALCLAAAATRTNNPLPLILILTVGWFVAVARRDPGPGADSYALFFRLALVVLALHVVLQALLSRHAQGLIVLFTLPEIPLPAETGVKLGGAVTLEAVLSATYHGLQLATIFCCIGAANALASARRLVRYLPAALYELGVAVVIALTFAPQLAADARRVRRAARLRSASGTRLGRGRIRRFGRLAMPVLEGALERSVALAASMDSRGYGRTTGQTPSERRATVTLVVASSLGLAAGTYGLLTAHGYGVPLLLGGGALGVLGLYVGGRRTRRTRYRPDPWALPELLVVGCGLVAAAAMFRTAETAPQLLELASVTDLPPLPLLACAGVLVAALPAFLAPPLPAPRDSATVRERRPEAVPA